ncbi:WLM domain-containing protein [Pilaira anomala]|nr:WLM domain-containing protein [Pilaira anomala]
MQQPHCVALKKKLNSDKALLLLEKLFSQVKPILNKRNWTIKNLYEFYPTNENLLGVNYNKGWKINLRLRYAHDENSFLEYEDILGTLLHEMAHIVRSPHDEQFYKVLQELKNETEVLIASGYTGEGFHSNGKTLGSQSVPRYKSKQVSAAAAEKRLQTSRIMLPTGGIKLGSNSSSSSSSLLRNDMTPAQLAAEAAEKRLKDQVWCGGSITENSRSSSIQQKRKNDSNTPKAQTKRSCVTIDLTEESDWSCATCTFINKSVEFVCQVCLSLRKKNSSNDEIISLDDDDGWNCSQCTLKNSETNNVCDACAFKRFI